MRKDSQGLQPKDLRDLEVIKGEKKLSDDELVLSVRQIFGKWADYSFTTVLA